MHSRLTLGAPRARRQRLACAGCSARAAALDASRRADTPAERVDRCAGRRRQRPRPARRPAARRHPHRAHLAPQGRHRASPRRRRRRSPGSRADAVAGRRRRAALAWIIARRARRHPARHRATLDAAARRSGRRAGARRSESCPRSRHPPREPARGDRRRGTPALGRLASTAPPSRCCTAARCRASCTARRCRSARRAPKANACTSRALHCRRRAALLRAPGGAWQFAVYGGRPPPPTVLACATSSIAAARHRAGEVASATLGAA